MDKKNWIVIAACLALIFAYPAIINHFYPPVKLTAEQVAEQQKQKAAAAALSQAAAESGVTAPASTGGSQPSLESGEIPNSQRFEPNIPAEQLVSLENEFVKVEFTTHGGAIQNVTLKEHKTEGENRVLLNRGGPMPILNLRGWGPSYGISGYTVQSQTANSVTLVRSLSPNLTLERTYTLISDYSIELSQTVVNKGTQPEVLGPYILDLGSSTPIYSATAERQMIGLSWFNATNDYRHHKLHEFDSTSIPLLGIPLWSGKTVIESKPEEKISWVALKTQFFVVLVNPVDFTADKVEGTRRIFPELGFKNQPKPDGIIASMTVPGIQVEPGASVTQKFDVYAGPRENSRLVKLSENRAQVMEFGYFALVSRFLLWTMNHINAVVHSYGWSIVLLTIFLKAILWVPQGMANKSMKRMSAVAPVIKEIQDKYKDKPEKLNEEMIKVYRDYGVNPVGGCLPMLLQFPIFLGFYSMLQTAIELRHQSFLWIPDLSQADTLFRIPLHFESLGLNSDFPVNPMPLIMACTMYWSMHVTPQPAGVDNPMVKIMKFMPLMFLAFCYNFSAALSLYWTVQNLLSIVQLYYNTHFQKEVTLDEMKAQVAAKKKAAKKKKL